MVRRMKKICFVTTVSITLKSFVVETAKYLHEKCGYDVTLICDNDEEFASSLPEYIHYIPVPMSRGIDISGFASVLKFYKVFRKEKFDLVQYSTPNAACYASIASFLARVPIRLYAQWGIRYIGLSGLSRKIFKTIERMVCMLSTHIRAQSPKNMKFAIDEKLCKPEKISVVGIGGTIGVDLKECTSFDSSEVNKELRKKYKIPEDAFLYGYVGRINTDKGVNELVEAFKKLVTQKDAYLVLVGKLDDYNPITQENIEYVQENNRIILTGNVPRTDVYRHMAMFDCLVHPTYREGFGKVIQEAMGMKLPVITTNIPGPSEVIENNISGILCEVKNADDLAEKMIFLYENDVVRNSYAQAGLERAKKYFDRPIMLHNILIDMKNIIEK